MSLNSQLEELLDRWEDARESGEHVDLAELWQLPLQFGKFDKWLFVGASKQAAL